MRFNAKKCAVMHLGKNNPCHQYTLGGHTLETSKQEKDIGVIIQDNGKVDEQCRKVALTCNRIIGQVSRSFSNRSPDLMIRIFKCYILPHIEYGLSVWNPYLQKDVKTLEAIQRRFTRLVSGMQNLSYEERLSKLGLPTLEARRKTKDLIQAYRIWTGIDQIDGMSFTKLSEYHTKSTRASMKDNFVAPKARLNQRKHFFSVRVVQDWNKLPVTLQRATSLQSFKSQLKKIIF